MGAGVSPGMLTHRCPGAPTPPLPAAATALPSSRCPLPGTKCLTWAWASWEPLGDAVAQDPNKPLTEALKTSTAGAVAVWEQAGLQQTPASDPAATTGTALAWPGTSLCQPRLPVFGCSDTHTRGCSSPRWVTPRGRPFPRVAWSQRLEVLGWALAGAVPRVQGDPILGFQAHGQPVPPTTSPSQHRAGAPSQALAGRSPPAPRAPSPHHPLRQQQLQFLTAPSFLSHSSRPPAQKPGRERNKE